MNHFDPVKIQPRAWSILSRSFSAGRVASTYLFYGPDGLGHWPLAVSFAALLNCLEPVGAGESGLVTPCARCRHCRNIFALNFEWLYFALPIRSHKSSDEMIELTGEVLQEKREQPFRIVLSPSPTSIPIRMARDIKKALSLKGGEGITRVALFYRMEKMKASSADALLKLIEEPSSDTVIILTATRPDTLLPTIQSRAQKVRLDGISESAAVAYLASKYGTREDRARLVVRLSQGNIGKAIAMTDDTDEPDSSRRAVGFLLFRSLFTETRPATIALLTKLISQNDRSAAEELLVLWQSLLRDCAYYAATGDGDALVNTDFASELIKIARFFERTQLAVHMTAAVKNALADLYLNVHIQTALAALVLTLKSRIPVAG